MDIDKELMLDVIGKEPFILRYDFSMQKTLLGITKDHTNIIDNLTKTFPGFSFKKVDKIYNENDKNTRKNSYKILSVYRKADTINKNLFLDIFDLSLNVGSLSILFIPLKPNEVESTKKYIESLLSKRNARETKSMQSDSLSMRLGVSLQHENFMNSEETLFGEEILESINFSLLRNATAYNIYFIIDDDSNLIEKYVENRFLIFSRFESKIIEPLKINFNKVNPLPVGINIVKLFINFRGILNIGYSLPTIYASSSEGFPIGTLMKNATVETSIEVKINPSALNLGVILTGLPGSGKTNEAMAIIDGLFKFGQHKVVVLSPTDEWNDFANSHNMYLIKMYDKNTPINFFRCPDNSKVDKFYEDLSMILSSASNAGPYAKPMEKCMLNAFRKIYQKTKIPDPIAVYKEIEEAIIKFHGKKTNRGVIYTKHGENIKSELENLRSILNRIEYSSREGIKIEELLDKGVVFDLSNVSIGTKPYLYALILNQLYAISSTFDTKGDNEIRLLICIEEAQLIFRDRESAAIEDLKYRIQDFRKQGIGLMLLTHNVIDIDSSIRRLCQIKLYLKQAPDVAEDAASDLIFTYADTESVLQKLKHLNSRVGALNYVVKNNKEKLSLDTIFIKTKDYENRYIENNNLLSTYMSNKKINTPKRISMKIHLIIDSSYNNKINKNFMKISSISLLYLNDEVANVKIKAGYAKISNLIGRKLYTLNMLDENKRIIFSRDIIATPELKINIKGDDVEIKNINVDVNEKIGL
ncbi:MAG: hypothetical protein ACP5UN_03065 [Candidatus Micrarchaeia archaeon]